MLGVAWDSKVIGVFVVNVILEVLAITTTVSLSVYIISLCLIGRGGILFWLGRQIMERESL